MVVKPPLPAPSAVLTIFSRQRVCSCWKTCGPATTIFPLTFRLPRRADARFPTRAPVGEVLRAFARPSVRPPPAESDPGLSAARLDGRRAQFFVAKGGQERATARAGPPGGRPLASSYQKARAGGEPGPESGRGRRRIGMRNMSHSQYLEKNRPVTLSYTQRGGHSGVVVDARPGPRRIGQM